MRDQSIPADLPAYKGPDKHVFVCYAHADAALVYAEIKALAQAGLPIWYDEGIEARREWRAEIAEALDKASAVLFYQSRASTASKHCIREISYALDAEIPIVRIDLDGCALPPALRLGLQAEQAIEPRQYSRADYRQRLQRALSAVDDETVGVGSINHGPRNWRIAVPLSVGLTLVVGLGWLALNRPSTVVPARSLSMILSDTQPIGAPHISADGTMLAYAMAGDLFVRRIGGGAAVQLTDTAEIETYPRFSPDGERIAFTRRESDALESRPDIYVMPTLGGNATPVVTSAVSASWSSDGENIVYVQVDKGRPAGIAVADSDGANARMVRVRSGDYYPYSPVWSPDGRYLAYVRSIGGSSGEIWLMNAAGEELRRLSQDNQGAAHSPVYTPDGLALVYSSNKGGATNIWQTTLDGASSTQLTTGPGPHEWPSVAANGAVAFLSAKWRRTLSLYTLDGNNRRDIYAHTHFLWSAAFAPDGREIAFARAEPDGTWHIWLIGVDGRNARQLTVGASSHIYPRFTPDGAHVLYMEWAAGANRIWQIPRRGGTPALVTPPDVDASYADVSHLGQLAYVVPRGDQTRVYTKSPGAPEVSMYGDYWAEVPRWSPNGQQLVFARDRGLSGRIQLADVRGGNPVGITDRGGFPVWWPDGERIGYVVLGQKGSQHIRVKDLSTGMVETLPISYLGAGIPFDVHASGQLVTTHSVPFSHEVWVLD